MNRADILKQIADYHQGLADLYQILAADSASAPESAARPVAAVSPPAAPASTFDSQDYEQGFIEDAVTYSEQIPDGIPVNSAQDAVLGECPVHFRAWTIREGGISKNGKPYKAFWKCSGKNADGSYCNKKPTPGWVKTHDPEKALAAA